MTETIKENFSPECLIDEFINSDTEFEDNFQTHEQKVRDIEITKLLKKYVESYCEKIKIQSKYRKVLLVLCSSVIVSFSIVFLILLLLMSFGKVEFCTANTVNFVSICITFLLSVLGLVQTITKYCFPENDEEYISKIVETIQANDLQNKLANMNNSNSDCLPY